MKPSEAKKGGGTAIAINENLKPKLIEEYSDKFELLVVEVETIEKNIRIISGYGPQENIEEDKRVPFFLALETEIEKATLAGASIIIEADMNSKLGPKYIPNDPHELSPNGSLLAAIIERQNLIVGNGSQKCRGTITRKRTTSDRTETSAIDVVMFSNDLNNHLVSVHIDEDRKHVLSRIHKTKRGTKIKESDHNSIITELDCRIIKDKDEKKVELFDLKDKDSQAKFKAYTTGTNMFSSIFNNESDDIDDLTNRLVKKINGSIAINFKKRRVSKKKVSESDVLYDRMRFLKGKEDDKSKNDLEAVVKAIAENAETNFNKLKQQLDKIKPEDGGVNAHEMWKLRKKMCPKNSDPPTAMTDKNGNLLTSDKSIQGRALEAYSERLENNKIEPHLKDLENDTNELCDVRIQVSKRKITPPWDMDDLKLALKQLGKEKSRDPEGFNNELFKEEVAGDDLMKAVLKLMNLIKKKQQYPSILEKCNITSIYKKKSRRNFDNYRGVFRVQVLRSILDRLTYNDSYYTIDSNLTDGNVGARKQRSARDNIFVISAICNSVLNGTSAPIQIQVMDAEKCFDKLWLQSCINGLFDAGLDNDQLNLLYIENKNASIAVKVNNKLSMRISVKDVIMQGSVWSSLKCTTSMDRMNQTALADEAFKYCYKGDPEVPIGILGFIDDTLGVSECGSAAIRKNAAINSFIETQRLKLSAEKSVVVHVGKPNKCTVPCPVLKVHRDPMKDCPSTKYLGNFVSSSGGCEETVEDRRKKGWGKIATIMGILGAVDMGCNQLEAGLLLRQSILVNSLLYSAESWSGVTEKQLARLESVDNSLLSQLTGGHRKCALEFNHLETGTLKLRHILTYRRLMFHHEILTRDSQETLSKVYRKQKEEPTKGDWFTLLEKDFGFLGIAMNEEQIKRTPKEQYKKEIMKQIRSSAFTYFMNLKETHTKLDSVQYNKLEFQQYLGSKLLTNKEKTLLYLLRSRCYDAKSNFKKLFKNQLNCRFGCLAQEDQAHIFKNCHKINSIHKENTNIEYSDIFCDVTKQIRTIKQFSGIEKIRLHLKNHHLPGGGFSQDPCKFNCIY